MEVLYSASDAPAGASANDLHVDTGSSRMNDVDRALIANGVAAAARVMSAAEEVEQSRAAVGAAMVKATKAAKQVTAALEEVRQAAQATSKDRVAVAAIAQTVTDTAQAVSAKAVEAAASATAAAGKAVEAGESAKLATTKATSAASSATVAGAKAIEAGTYATAAATSASTATTKAKEASASAQIAAAARDEIVARLDGVGGMKADLANALKIIASLTAQVDQLLGGGTAQPQPLRDHVSIETTSDTIVIHG